MIAETEHELKKLFKTEHAEEYFAQDASISSQARILTNALIKKYTDLFASLSKPMAERFAEESDKSSDIAVKSSIRHLSDELTLSTKTITSGPLNDILNATVTENVGLIKSIPAQYLTGVQGAVMRSITTGNGMQDLVPYLQKHKGITLRRARMIAQDQTKKAFSEPEQGADAEDRGRRSTIWRAHQRLAASRGSCTRNERQAVHLADDLRFDPSSGSFSRENCRRCDCQRMQPALECQSTGSKHRITAIDRMQVGHAVCLPTMA